MPLREAIRLAIQSVLSAKLRSFFTLLGIIVSVWLNPSVATIEKLDHKILFDIHRKATALAIHKAMTYQPTIDWLLENQDKVIHKYFEKGLKGEI